MLKIYSEKKYTTCNDHTRQKQKKTISYNDLFLSYMNVYFMKAK